MKNKTREERKVRLLKELEQLANINHNTGGKFDNMMDYWLEQKTDELWGIQLQERIKELEDNTAETQVQINEQLAIKLGKLKEEK